MARTDIHRPSVINPTEYDYVGIEYQKVENFGDVQLMGYYRERIRKHMEATGGTYSRHKHGGNCHVCGAHCIYTALFYHRPTNVYIRTGFDCADKLGYLGDKEFTSFRQAIRDARDHYAGKQKAKLFLEDRGLSKAWECYNWTEDQQRDNRAGDEIRGTYHWTFEYRTIRDIIDRLVKYGKISDKQVDFVAKLLPKVYQRTFIETKQKMEREAERAAAKDCPEGRITFTGQIVSARVSDGFYGFQVKCLIKAEDGWKTWGTMPSAIIDELRGIGALTFRDGRAMMDRERTATVTMTATIRPSDDDTKFGFYSRPSKPSVIVETNSETDS